MKKFIAGTILAALLAVACFPLNADADESSEPNQEASLHHMKEGSASWTKDCANLAKQTDRTNSQASSSTDFKPKTLSKTGNLQYTITSVKTAEVKKTEASYTSAEYNDFGLYAFPDKYFQTEISYSLKNTGHDLIALYHYQANIQDASGIPFTRNRTATNNFCFDDPASAVLQPESSMDGTFYLLSAEKPDMSSFTIFVPEQYDPQGEMVGAGGTGVFG